jgi:hypothetical protein
VALPAELLALQIVAHSDIIPTPLSSSSDGDAQLVLKCYGFQDLAGKKSGREDGSTLGIRRFGSGGTGARLYRSFHLAFDPGTSVELHGRRVEKGGVASS